MAGAFLWLLLQLYGGSAQNFGSSRPNWSSYGWAAFAVPAKPAGSPLTQARLEVGCYAIQVLAASVHRYLLLPNIPTVVCSTQSSRAIGGMQCCGTSSSSASVRLAKSNNLATASWTCACCRSSHTELSAEVALSLHTRLLTTQYLSDGTPTPHVLR